MSGRFPDNWQLLPIEDVMEAIIDYRGKTPKKTSSGIPLITAKIVKGGSILPPSEYIANEDYDSWMVRGLPQIGDVVITTEAPLGEVAQLTDPNVALAQRIVTLRGKSELLNNDYLLFALQSDFVQHQLESRASGSTVKGIKQSELRKVELPIPPIHEQLEIGRILRQIWAKSQLNTQINQTLEEMAQAIFKSWFVDFDPVVAKMEVLSGGGSVADSELAAMGAIGGRDKAGLQKLKQSSPEQYKQLADTAALFPSTLEDSELGPIPHSWEVKPLKDCTTEIRRGISPKYIEEGGIKVINQKCIRNHTINFELTRRNDQQKRNVDGRLIEIGDVLVNSTGVGTLGRLAPVRYLPEDMVVDSHVTVVRADTNEISKQYLAGIMLLNEGFIESSGAGSTGQTELRKQVIEDIVIARPNKEICEEFEKLVDGFSQQIATLEAEQPTLSELRDTLLPKLLSGEIDVSNLNEVTGGGE